MDYIYLLLANEVSLERSKAIIFVELSKYNITYTSFYSPGKILTHIYVRYVLKKRPEFHPIGASPGFTNNVPLKVRVISITMTVHKFGSVLN